MSHFRRSVPRACLLLALPMLLGACAVPLGVTIATTAASGVTYVATGKTMSDNALSILAQQDCRLLRGFQGESVCIDSVEEADAAADIPPDALVPTAAPFVE